MGIDSVKLWEVIGQSVAIGTLTQTHTRPQLFLHKHIFISTLMPADDIATTAVPKAALLELYHIDRFQAPSTDLSIAEIAKNAAAWIVEHGDKKYGAVVKRRILLTPSQDLTQKF
ncbi:unnamed protein product [Toxocara canis]|uniref:PIN_6 domain-containing protein n=1 Tax=Toxocara canis TaxID=6265 RepID=A0A183UB67_TOXCA|nr:unnamed protein product [Toxocara canis]